MGAGAIILKIYTKKGPSHSDNPLGMYLLGFNTNHEATNFCIEAAKTTSFLDANICIRERC